VAVFKLLLPLLLTTTKAKAASNDVVFEGGMVRSTRGTRQHRVFTISSEVCAGSSTMERSPSTTSLLASAANFSSPRFFSPLSQLNCSFLIYYQLLLCFSDSTRL